MADRIVSCSVCGRLLKATAHIGGLRVRNHLGPIEGTTKWCPGADRYDHQLVERSA